MKKLKADNAKEVKDLQAKIKSVCCQPANHEQALVGEMKSLKTEKKKFEQTLKKMTEACEKLKA